MKRNIEIYRLVIGIILCLTLVAANLYAQDSATPPRTTKFTLDSAPSPEALNKHDLKWIKTGNDFEQSKYATAEEVDREIEKRIKAYDRETPVVTFEVPINLKPDNLSYLKFQKYSDFQSEISNLNIAKNGGPLDKNAHFWKYGRGETVIHIAVPGDTYKDQLNVYSIARAIEILKYRYPQAYQKLFVETRIFPSNQPSFGNPKYKNKYSVLLISFDESPSDIAGSLVALGKYNLVNDIQEYPNTGIVSIDNINIQGSTDSGSKPIYQSSPEENYVRYLREGLIETIVHEMLHLYISFRHSYETVYNGLYWSRNNNLGSTGEEAVVVATSQHHFLRAGGLQSNIQFYYGIDLSISINKLTNAGLLNKYTQMINPGVNYANYKDLRLTLLD